MIRIFKGAAISALFALVLAGCGANLWYSGSSRSADFTIEISMPTPDELTPVSRALALQGKAIYVEIALINDAAVYANPDGNGQTDDSAFYSVFNSNGEWVETNWGGYAARQITTTGINPIAAGFTGIPTDRDLLVRVMQDVDGLTIATGMPGYLPGDGYAPISQTYNPGASGPMGELGVRITTTQLRNGYVDLPIRPHPYQIFYTYNVAPYQNPESFIGFTASAHRPNAGNTRFSDIALDMGFDTTVGPGLLIGSRIEMVSGSQLPGIIQGFDKRGRRLPTVISRATSSGGNTVVDVFSFAKPVIDPQTSQNTDYFFGATVAPGINLATDPNYISFDLLAVPLVGTNVYSSPVYDQNPPYDVVSHQIQWDPLSINLNVIRPDDLQYKVVHWYGPGNPLANNYDMEAILSLNPQVVMDWSTAVQYFVDQGGDGDYFDVPDVGTIPGIVFSPLYTDSYLTAVLARFPGSEPFLVGVYFGYYSGT